MRVLVTGGTGFVGRAVVERLCASGLEHPLHPLDYPSYSRVEVVACARSVPALDLPCEFVAVDLSDIRSIRASGLMHRDFDVIFHCAAMCTYWGEWDAFVAANVTATRNVVDLLCGPGSSRLVHVSTSTVYACGYDRLSVRERDVVDGDAFISHYGRTKWMAERVIVASPVASRAIILRPRAIFGPGDGVLLPTLVAKLKSGRVPVIGGGRALTDMVFIDNLVDCMLCSAVVLLSPSSLHSGCRVFNVTNGEPVMLYSDIIRPVCIRLGLPIPSRRVPLAVVWSLAIGLEILWTVMGSILPRGTVRVPPPFTRQTVASLGVSLTLDISDACRVLKYRPRVSVADGLDITLASSSLSG